MLLQAVGAKYSGVFPVEILKDCTSGPRHLACEATNLPLGMPGERESGSRQDLCFRRSRKKRLSWISSANGVLPTYPTDCRNRDALGEKEFRLESAFSTLVSALLRRHDAACGDNRQIPDSDQLGAVVLTALVSCAGCVGVSAPSPAAGRLLWTDLIPGSPQGPSSCL